MLESCINRALIAGITIACISGMMGCFVVWRRMAYFGDSLAHSALLGIALGLFTSVDIQLTTIFVCALFATLLLWLQHKRILSTDSLLGILAHASLSFGMVALSILDQHIDLHDYLFGDLLSVSHHELYWILAGGLVVFSALLLFWPSFVLITLNEDLAKSEGVNHFAMQLLIMFLMTVVVSISTHLVGILLITSMLIIPAATARQMATSPESMAFIATVIGIISVISGVHISVEYSTPSSPTVIAVAATLFFILFPLASIVKSYKKRHTSH